MKITLYCKCGAAWKGTADPKTAAGIIEHWKCLHTGPGHTDTDSRTATQARVRAEQQKGEPS